jgi:hypothetical protein
VLVHDFLINRSGLAARGGPGWFGADDKFAWVGKAY